MAQVRRPLLNAIGKVADATDRLTSVQRPWKHIGPSPRMVRYFNWTRASIVVAGVAWGLAGRRRSSRLRPPTDRD